MVDRRLWVISELYYPEATSTGYILTAIAEGLASGFEVNVLCGQPSYSARGTRAPVSETRNGVSIRRCAATTLNKDVFWFRLVNLVSVSLSIFFQALFRIRRDESVLVVTNPPALPFLIAAVCGLRGARFVLLVHDVYPEVAIASGMLRKNSRLCRLGAWLNRWLYRKAARVVVLGRDMQALAAERLAVGERWRVVVIPNWADVDDVAPRPSAGNQLRQELGLNGKFVVEYAGNMGYPNDLESVIEAAAELQSNQMVSFLFIGSGAKRKLVAQAIHARGLSNITLLPGRPRSDQGNFLNACDLAVISLVDGMTGVSVPSRVYNTMAAGKPILAIMESESEVACIIDEERIGWVIPPGQPEEVSEAILTALARPADLAEMGCRARLAAENKYTFDRARQAYLDLFMSLEHQARSND